MHRFIKFIGIAVLLLTFEIQRPLAQNFSEPAATLIDLWAEANNRCRGASGDDPKTEASCDERERLSARLNKQGLCLSGAKVEDWKRCNLKSQWWFLVASIPVGDDLTFTPAALRDRANALNAVRKCGFTPTEEYAYKFDGLMPHYSVIVIGPWNSRLTALGEGSSIIRCIPDAQLRHLTYDKDKSP